MLPGIRSLAVAMHLEIYWVYTPWNNHIEFESGIDRVFIIIINLIVYENFA